MTISQHHFHIGDRIAEADVAFIGLDRDLQSSLLWRWLAEARHRNQEGREIEC